MRRIASPCRYIFSKKGKGTLNHARCKYFFSTNLSKLTLIFSNDGSDEWLHPYTVTFLIFILIPSSRLIRDNNSLEENS